MNSFCSVWQILMLDDFFLHFISMTNDIMYPKIDIDNLEFLFAMLCQSYRLHTIVSGK